MNPEKNEKSAIKASAKKVLTLPSIALCCSILLVLSTEQERIEIFFKGISLVLVGSMFVLATIPFLLHGVMLGASARKNGVISGIPIATKEIRFKENPVRFFLALIIFWGCGTFFILAGFHWFHV